MSQQQQATRMNVANSQGQGPLCSMWRPLRNSPTEVLLASSTRDGEADELVQQVQAQLDQEKAWESWLLPITREPKEQVRTLCVPGPSFLDHEKGILRRSEACGPASLGHCQRWIVEAEQRCLMSPGVLVVSSSVWHRELDHQSCQTKGECGDNFERAGSLFHVLSSGTAKAVHGKCQNRSPAQAAKTQMERRLSRRDKAQSHDSESISAMFCNLARMLQAPNL